MEGVCISLAFPFPMNKKIRLIIFSVLLIGGAVLAWSQYSLYKTKQFSPAEKAIYETAQINIEVDYCRPKRAGRTVFGELVPYGRWWRTGANEPTQIELSRDISFSGKILKAGLYSIVTIPEAESWTVIFNNRIPDWGTYYYPKDDELRVIGKIENLPEPIESFTIDFSEEDGLPTIIFAWDQVKVTLPFKVL